MGKSGGTQEEGLSSWEEASKQTRTGSAQTDSDSGWKGWRPSHPAFKAFTRPLNPASAATPTCTSSNIWQPHLDLNLSGTKSSQHFSTLNSSSRLPQVRGWRGPSLPPRSSAHTRRQHLISDAMRDPSPSDVAVAMAAISLLWPTKLLFPSICWRKHPDLSSCLQNANDGSNPLT